MHKQRAIGRRGVESGLIAGATAFLVCVTLLPILMVVVMSFTAGNTLRFPPPGLSFRWYHETWAMIAGTSDSLSRLSDSVQVSLAIAISTAVVCVGAGVPASYALCRCRFPGRRVMEELQGLPLVFPVVVLGIALLVLVSASGIDFGIWQIVAAHSIICFPFMMRNCTAALESIDPALEEAARTLGASGLRTFSEVIFPLMRGGITSGILLVVVLSFNEFTLSYFLYTVDVFPLSIWLFQQANTSFSPTIFAVSAIIVVVNVAVILIVDAVVGQRRRMTRM
jgi:putative spermidine/putrescine transport system permease protein